MSTPTTRDGFARNATYLNVQHETNNRKHRKERQPSSSDVGNTKRKGISIPGQNGILSRHGPIRAKQWLTTMSWVLAQRSILSLSHGQSALVDAQDSKPLAKSTSIPAKGPKQYAICGATCYRKPRNAFLCVCGKLCNAIDMIATFASLSCTYSVQWYWPNIVPVKILLS